MLDNRNITTQRPSRKLYHNKVGPLQVSKQVGTRAYKLELPPNSRMHLVFHASLLEPYRKSKDPEREVQRLEMKILKGEENWEVREIVESRRNGRKRGKPVEYLVLWEGYPDEEATWEPYKHLRGTSEDRLKEFHRKYPGVKRDSRVRL